MTADVIPLRRPQRDTPRAAIRAALREAVFAELDGGRVALTLPREVVERLYAAAIGGDGA